MDWLRLEQRLRDTLREYKKRDISAKDCLELISIIIGEETGRGYELDEEE